MIEITEDVLDHIIEPLWNSVPLRVRESEDFRQELRDHLEWAYTAYQMVEDEASTTDSRSIKAASNALKNALHHIADKQLQNRILAVNIMQSDEANHFELDDELATYEKLWETLEPGIKARRILDEAEHAIRAATAILSKSIDRPPQSTTQFAKRQTWMVPGRIMVHFLQRIGAPTKASRKGSLANDTADFISRSLKSVGVSVSAHTVAKLHPERLPPIV